LGNRTIIWFNGPRKKTAMKAVFLQR